MKNDILPFAALIGLGVGVLNYTAPKYPSEKYLQSALQKSYVKKISENCYNPAVSMDHDVYENGFANYYQPHSGFIGHYYDKEEDRVINVDNGYSTYFPETPPEIGIYYEEMGLCLEDSAECSTESDLEENDNPLDSPPYPQRIYSYGSGSEALDYYQLYNVFKGNWEEAMLRRYLPKECNDFMIVGQGNEFRPEFMNYCEKKDGTPCPKTTSDVLRLLPEDERETLVGLMSGVSPYSYPDFLIDQGLLY